MGRLYFDVLINGQKAFEAEEFCSPGNSRFDPLIKRVAIAVITPEPASSSKTQEAKFEGSIEFAPHDLPSMYLISIRFTYQPRYQEWCIHSEDAAKIVEHYERLKQAEITNQKWAPVIAPIMFATLIAALMILVMFIAMRQYFAKPISESAPLS